MDQSDQQLFDAALSGSGDALARLLRRHGPAVRHRLRINPVWQGTLDAADVMQVTYLEAFLQVHQLADRTPAGFQRWLNRLAENNLRDAIKALERQKRPDPRQQNPTRRTGRLGLNAAKPPARHGVDPQPQRGWPRVAAGTGNRAPAASTGVRPGRAAA